MLSLREKVRFCKFITLLNYVIMLLFIRKEEGIIYMFSKGIVADYWPDSYIPSWILNRPVACPESPKKNKWNFIIIIRGFFISRIGILHTRLSGRDEGGEGGRRREDRSETTCNISVGDPSWRYLSVLIRSCISRGNLISESPQPPTTLSSHGYRILLWSLSIRVCLGTIKGLTQPLGGYA